MKWCIATAVAISLALAAGASAQDDFDWDGLLGDDEPVAEAAADAAPAVEEAADDFADFADEAPAPVEAAADDFADFGDDALDAAEDFADGTTEAADDFADGVAEAADDAADDFGDIFADAAEEAPASAAPAFDDDMFGGFDAADAAPAFDDEPAAEPADEGFAPYAAADDDFGAAEKEESVVPAKKPGSRYAERVSAKEAKKIAKEVSYAEEVRRQAAQDDASRLAADGMRALDANKPAQAENLLKQALDQMPVRDETAAERASIVAALAEAKFLRAKALYDTKDDAVLSDAREIVDSGLELAPNDRALRALDRQLAKREAAAAAYKPPAKRSEVIEEKLDIRDLYIEARQWYSIKDYDRAAALFEQILTKDPYHKSAMRYLAKIEKDRFNVATTEREARRNGLLTQIRQSWNPPVRVAVDIPKETAERESRATKPASQAVLEKMRDIIIPKLEFRQANIADVVNYLVEASIAADPSGEGVNIILNLGDGGAVASAPAAAPAAADDGWGSFDDDFGAPAPVSGGSSGGVPPITLNLRNVSMSDAINFITEVARLKYRVENTAVIITSKDAAVGNIITRMYPVQPSFLDVVVQRQEMTADDRERDFVGLGGNVTMQKSEVKDFFEKTGVPFPTGASITYNSAISQLIVANTAENLETFEKILQQINVIPNQVEIEARFIEVNQNDLEELGLQWILNDNWEIATKRDGSGARIQMNSGNITSGIRSYGYNSASGAIEPVNSVVQTTTQTLLGPIASFSSVLTNPELSVVLHALSQHGGSDLLSAPRVTTRSGVNAQIQVVKEIIYPTEFDLTQPTVNSDGDVTMAPIVTPGSFETRATGVILNVTPTVGADGYTIDLVMAPEVAELVDWIQYGSVITVVNESYQFNMPMPVFTSRNVATSLVIWDGQTVVMGGLIREEVSTIKDKIPILGDIPLLGRFFRNEGSFSQKKNLLIFVTARLVDPAGRPVHGENALLPGAGVETAAPES